MFYAVTVKSRQRERVCALTVEILPCVQTFSLLDARVESIVWFLLNGPMTHCSFFFVAFRRLGFCHSRIVYGPQTVFDGLGSLIYKNFDEKKKKKIDNTQVVPNFVQQDFIRPNQNNKSRFSQTKLTSRTNPETHAALTTRYCSVVGNNQSETF